MFPTQTATSRRRRDHSQANGLEAKTEPDQTTAASTEIKSEGATAAETPIADGSADNAPAPSSEGALREVASGTTAIAAAVKVADAEPPAAPDGIAPAPNLAAVHGEHVLAVRLGRAIAVVGLHAVT